MPVTKQAKKKLRVDKKREKQNSKIKENLKKTIKKTRGNITQKSLSQAVKIIDKAAKKNVIHKNKAARIKSRLAKIAPKTSPSKGKK